MKRSKAGKPIRSWSMLGWVTLVIAVIVSGCTVPTQANLAPCSGSYAGTYSGAGGGAVTGSLTASGGLNLSFTPTAPGSAGFSYQVTSVKGDFAGNNPDDVSASFDLSSCRISGIWVFQGNSGIYSVSIQRP